MHRYFKTMLLAPLAMLTMVAASPAHAAEPFNVPEEVKAIHALLDNYTQSVTQHDAKRFESQLLDQNIPFMGTYKLDKPGFVATSQSVADYSGFKAVIFGSKQRFSQVFKDVKIEQQGNMAQVSLQYITTDTATGEGGGGWKILQLLKVHGEWKIASEFF